MGTSLEVSRLVLGGITMFKDSDAATTVRKDLFAGKCRVMEVAVTNNSALSAESVSLVVFDDSNPTLNTSVEDYVLDVPTNGTRTFQLNPGSTTPGVQFDNGFSFAVVKSATWATTATAPTGTCTVFVWGKEV